MAKNNYKNAKQRIRARARAEQKKDQPKHDFCNFFIFPLLTVIATAFFFNIENIVCPLLFVLFVMSKYTADQ